MADSIYTLEEEVTRIFLYSVASSDALTAAAVVYAALLDFGADVASVLQPSFSVGLTEEAQQDPAERSYHESIRNATAQVLLQALEAGDDATVELVMSAFHRADDDDGEPLNAMTARVVIENLRMGRGA